MPIVCRRRAFTPSGGQTGDADSQDDIILHASTLWLKGQSEKKN
jgi:hypothetical protein